MARSGANLLEGMQFRRPRRADQPLLFLFLREGAIGPSVTKAFQIGSRDLSDVCEPVGRGPREELLLENRSQLAVPTFTVVFSGRCLAE